MESFSLHSGLVILLIVLLSTAVSTEDIEKANRLGPASTVITIVGVFAATIVFFMVSNWLILRNSHDNTGLLGFLAKRLTKPAVNEQNVQADAQRRPQRVRRTKSMQRTLTMVDRAVTYDKAVKIQTSSSTSKAEAMSAIKEREKKADARVRQRLLERRNKNGNKQNQKLSKQVKSWQVEPTNFAKDVESIKIQLIKKIKTKKRLINIFGKLDLDSNGVLSKKEFLRMIKGILKKKVNPNVMDCCWDAAWDMRKHGNKDEMDVGTVAHWLKMD